MLFILDTGVGIQNPMESLFVCLASIGRHCCEDFLLPSVSLLLNNHGSHVISVQETVAALASRDATFDGEFDIELPWVWPRNTLVMTDYSY